MTLIDSYPARDIDCTELVRRSVYAEHPSASEWLDSFMHRSQHCFVCYIKGEAAAVYGMIAPTLLSERAYIWLLVTNTIDHNKFLFVRHSQLVIERMLELYDTLEGETHIDDARALRWMKWLGAQYGGAPRGGVLLPFTITKGSFRRTPNG
jgi:hypothetical protein